MTPFVIRPHLSEPTFTKSLALNGVAADGETPSTVGEIYYQFVDEPDAKPEYLGRAVAGHSLRVPIDLQSRPILLSLVSRTSEGLRSVANITEAEQLVFTPSTTPVLSALTFDGMTGEVEGTIDENQGTGTIRILRQLGSDDFFEIDNVPAGTPSFTDIPDLDGTYTYKLMQDGQAGASNSRSVAVSGAPAPAGSPPSALSATFNAGPDTVTVIWTNNGGTGSNIVEQKIGSSGVFVAADSVSSGTSTTDISVSRGSTNVTYYYRVRNESVAGYSNEDSVTVPREA
jgi:hypothetical protein